MFELLNYILAFFILVLFVWLIILTIQYKKLIEKGKILFSEDPKGNLSETIEKYLKAVKDVEDHCYTIDNKLKKVDKVSGNSLHKTGFVRYNPFGDVGGNQSFSLCFLDEKENGFVISSIHSREGTRVYGKEVSLGDSNYNLSEEEKQALALAKKKVLK